MSTEMWHPDTWFGIVGVGEGVKAVEVCLRCRPADQSGSGIHTCNPVMQCVFAKGLLLPCM